MSANKPAGKRPWTDPDDAPELDDAFFAEAQLHHDRVPVRRGRPRKANPKRAVSIRLSAEVLEHFQSGGAGWQTRIDETLKKIVAAQTNGRPG